jgi:O-antigen ligase
MISMGNTTGNDHCRLGDSRARSKMIAWLIVLVLFAGTALLIPNGLNLRLQRTANFTFFLTVAAGIYILVAISRTLGCLMLWACAQLFIGGPRIDEYIIFSLAVFFIGAVLLRDYWQQYTGEIYDAIMLCATISVGFQVLQYFGQQYVAQNVQWYQYTGLMGNQDDQSCVIAVMLPVFLRKGRLKLLWIPILGLVLAKSFIGVAAAVAVFLIVAITLKTARFRAMLLIALFCSVLLFHFFVKPFNFANQKHIRLDIWKSSITVALVKPLAGWGFAQYDKVIPLLTSHKYLSSQSQESLVRGVVDKVALAKAAQRLYAKDTTYFTGDNQQAYLYGEAHNDYIEWLFAGGVIGGALLVITVLWSLFRAHIMSCNSKGFMPTARVPLYGLVASCVCAAVFFSWQIMPVQALTMFYLGVIYGGKNEKAPDVYNPGGAPYRCNPLYCR